MLGSMPLFNTLPLQASRLVRRGTDARQVCRRYLFFVTSEESTHSDEETAARDAYAVLMMGTARVINVGATRATGRCSVIPRAVSLSRALLSPCCTGCEGGR